MLDPSKVEALQSSLRGQVILPQDESDDAARKIYYGMIDKRQIFRFRSAAGISCISLFDYRPSFSSRKAQEFV